PFLSAVLLGRTLRNAPASLHETPSCTPGGVDDLHSGCPGAAARLATQRATVLGDLQRALDHVLPDLRLVFPRAVPCALDPRGGRRAHEARGPEASRGRRSYRTPRRTAWVALAGGGAQSEHNRAGHGRSSCA